METPRVKTIIIVILLIINGLLLVLVGARRSEARRYEQAALDGSIEVLAHNGIELTPDAIVNRTGYQSGTTQRNLEKETLLASVLLGEAVEGSSRGGGLYTYSSEHGQLSFRAGGELSSQLEKSAYWKIADPESYATTLADSLGLELQRIKFEVLGGNGTIVYRQMLDGVPLFSCQLELAFEDGYLKDMSGSLMAMDAVVFEEGEGLTLPTVLMHFLDDVLASGDVCSAILRVEPGYLLSQSFTSTITFQPVWYISTNTADYYVDGINGDLSRILN